MIDVAPDKQVVVVDILAHKSLSLARGVTHKDLISVGNTELFLIVGINESNLLRFIHLRSVQYGENAILILIHIVTHVSDPPVPLFFSAWVVLLSVISAPAPASIGDATASGCR